MDKTLLEKKLSLAISFIPEKDLPNFEDHVSKLEETSSIEESELKIWASNTLYEYLDNNDVEVDELEDYYGLSAESMIQLLKQAMEYSGIIGYFYDHMDLFKALFIKYPELLTQMED